MNKALLIAAVGTILAGSAGAAPITTWAYTGSVLQYVDATSTLPVWQSYAPGPDVNTTPLVDGIKIFGTGEADSVFQFTGTTYMPSPLPIPSPDIDPYFLRGNQLVISGTGTINGAAWVHPDDYIRTTFGIGFGFTGGTLNIYSVGTSFTLYNASNEFLIGVGSGTGLGDYVPGGYGVGFAFEDRFGSNFETAQTMDWQVTIAYDWTGMASTDTLNFSIPANSIDLQVLPEPATLSMLVLGGLAALRRRRK